VSWRQWQGSSSDNPSAGISFLTSTTAPIVPPSRLLATKIESRPIRCSRFEYLFYLDAVVPPGGEKDLDATVEGLEERSTRLRRPGTYPAGESVKS